MTGERARRLVAAGRALEVPVRESARSRTLRVTVGPDHPLEVVVPVGTGDRAIDRFLREKREWIARNVAAAEAIAAAPGRLGLDRPGLAFVHGEPVPVTRVRNRRPFARVTRGRVVVGGTPAQAEAAIERLYRRLAREAVTETAEREARQLDLNYRTDRHRRPAHALGLVLAARAALLLLAADARAARGTRVRGRPRALPPAPPAPPALVLAHGRGGLAGPPRSGAVATRARARTAALPAGPGVAAA